MTDRFQPGQRVRITSENHPGDACWLPRDGETAEVVQAFDPKGYRLRCQDGVLTEYHEDYLQPLAAPQQGDPT